MTKPSKLFTVLLTSLFVIKTISLLITNPVSANTQITYTRRQVTTSTLDYYVVEPSCEGEYDPVILLCGLGGTRDFDNLEQTAAKWVNSGNLDPVVYIVPIFTPVTGSQVDSQQWEYSRIQVNGKTKLEHLMDSIQDGTASSKIDTAADLTVAGFSMGAVATLDYGMRFNNRIVNVGAVSPAGILVEQGQGCWYSDAAVQAASFSTSGNAHRFMACSKVEMNGGAYRSVNKYDSLFQQDFELYFYESGEHNAALMYPEIFMFLYYVQHDVIPSQNIVSSAMNYVAPSTTEPSTTQPTTPVTPSNTTSTQESTTQSTAQQGSTSSSPTPQATASEDNVSAAPAPSTGGGDAAPAPVGGESPAPSGGEITAPTATGVEGFIERLYTVALGRSSDPIGAQYWLNRVNNGNATGADLARGFLYSQEFLSKNMTDEQFLDILYGTFFNRMPDAQGKAHWLNLLRNGMSRQQVINGFINSVEWYNLCEIYGIESGSAAAPRAS